MLSPHLPYQPPLAGNQYPMWYTPPSVAQWQALARAQAASPPQRMEPPKPTVSVKEQQQRPVNRMNVVRSEPERIQMPMRPVVPVAGVDYPQLPYGTRHRYL